MALTDDKQFMTAALAAEHILITFRKDFTPDAVGASLALARTLEKRGKKVDVAADGFAAPKTLAFLPGADRIKPALHGMRKFVISLDMSKTKIDELSYEVQGDKLKIHVTPKQGGFAPTDVSAEHKDYKYDLVVAIDTPDYQSLGGLFTDHADFFYARPVANIDHDPANERYGNLNLVDVTAASCCEAVYGLCAADGQHFLDPDTATCLLAGIISKTKSFKTPSVSPRTLDIASQLMAAGARRGDIVANLYRTRTIAALKLWGRALARLKHDAATRTAWTVLVRQDFAHAGAKESDLAGVVEELIMNAPEAEVVALIYEHEPSVATGATTDGQAMTAPVVRALIATETHPNALALVSALKPEGDRRTARVQMSGTGIVDAEKAVIETIRTAVRQVGMTDVINGSKGSA